MDETFPTHVALPGRTVFGEASGVVMRRVVWRRFVALVMRVGFPVAGAMALGALIGAVMGGGMVAFWVGVVGVMLVGLGMLGWAWWKRPSVYAAWALWDREAGRREAFAAAWWYESREVRTEAEERHLKLQAAELPGALGRLGVEMPVVRVGRLGWVIFGLAMTGVAGWWMDAVRRGPELSAEMVAAARVAAEQLAGMEVKAEKLAGLTEEERKGLEGQIKGAAEALSQSAGKTAREVLDALEQRAREAEKLAERVGAGEEAWASEALTEALRKQADTADLGDAVADRKGGEAADEAEALAGKIEAGREEQTERLEGVFNEVNAAAVPEDGERLVGSGVSEVANNLKGGEKAKASEAMRQMAQRLREMQGRQQTQAELERLAQQLREAGSQMANAGAEGEAMQALTEGSQGQSPKGGGQSGKAESAEGKGGQEGQEGQEGQMAQVSEAPESSGAGGQEGQAGQQGQAGQAGQAGPQGPQLSLGEGNPNAGKGGEKPDEGTPMLMAPVPGQDAGDKPPEMMVMMPGSSPSNGAILGAGSGLPPGSAKSEMKGEETAVPESVKSALAKAEKTGEGASSVRQVEGGAPREEGVGQGSAGLSVEFMEAQEAAMDEAALPMARREQVRRYFNALRKRLEGGK